MKQNETTDFLTRFTLREEELLTQVRERQLTLPERLKDWRLWIQDAHLYLSELADFVQTRSNQPGPAEEEATVTIISLWSKAAPGQSSNVKYDVTVPRSSEVNVMLEAAFCLTNAPDRPMGCPACATTAGDIMVVDGRPYLVEPHGFHPLTQAESERIQQLTCLQTCFGYDNLVRSSGFCETPTAPEG